MVRELMSYSTVTFWALSTLKINLPALTAVSISLLVILGDTSTAPTYFMPVLEVVILAPAVAPATHHVVSAAVNFVPSVRMIPCTTSMIPSESAS